MGVLGSLAVGFLMVVLVFHARIRRAGAEDLLAVARDRAEQVIAAENMESRLLEEIESSRLRIEEWRRVDSSRSVNRGLGDGIRPGGRGQPAFNDPRAPGNNQYQKGPVRFHVPTGLDKWPHSPRDFKDGQHKTLPSVACARSRWGKSVGRAKKV